MDINNQEKNFSKFDIEKIQESIKQLSYFFWVNHSDQDQLFYLRHFSAQQDVFEDTHCLYAGKDSWFTLAPGTVYFYYNNRPIAPLQLHETPQTYYIIIHKDGTIQCGIKKDDEK